jgi:hypothetical protein
MESIQETFYALSADFMKEFQIPFTKFFNDHQQYPILTQIFHQALSNIDHFALSMKKPLAFTVQHVHVDSAQHALSPELRMTSSPESYLKKRGLL